LGGGDRGRKGVSRGGKSGKMQTNVLKKKVKLCRRGEKGFVLREGGGGGSNHYEKKNKMKKDLPERLSCQKINGGRGFFHTWNRKERDGGKEVITIAKEKRGGTHR